MASPVDERVVAGLDILREAAAVGVVVEVADVARTLDDGHVAGLELLLQQVVPVEVAEPPVLLDVVDACNSNRGYRPLDCRSACSDPPPAGASPATSRPCRSSVGIGSFHAECSCRYPSDRRR